MKIYLILITIVITLLTSCDSQEAGSTQGFLKLVDIGIIEQDNNFLLSLDNGTNQLYFYDIDESCYLNFFDNIPGKTGLILPEFPYKFSVSSDERKLAVLSSSYILSIVDIDPLIDFYEKGCTQSVFPIIETTMPLEQLPDEVFFNKGENYQYYIYLIYKNSGKIVQYVYSNLTFTELSVKTYNSDITSFYNSGDQLYIATKDENIIYKYNSEGEDTIYQPNEDEINGSISNFIVKDNLIFFVVNSTGEFFIWDMDSLNYINISGIDDPINQNPFQSDKSLKFNYPINSISLYNHSFKLEDGELLNGDGILDNDQLIEGNYLVLNDTAGYTYFLTLDIDLSNITSYPSDDYESLEFYHEALNKRFLQYHQPLQNDYNVKITYLDQPSVCTQFNRQDANLCFSMIDSENDTENERYISISEEVKNRDYILKEERFDIIYEGVIPNSWGDDGSLTNSTVHSNSIDFTQFGIESDKIMLEILSTLSDDKQSEERCYPFIEDDQSFRYLSISTIVGNNLTVSSNYDHISIADYEYCFDQGISYQLRAKNSFIVKGTVSGFLGVSNLCSNETTFEDRVSCETDETLFTTPIFDMKIFSDKSDIETDSTISFFIGVSSTEFKYKYSNISPIQTLVDKFGDNFYILDTYYNKITIIKTDQFGEIDKVLQ